MPMFYFSELAAFDADDGLELATIDDARREAETALRNIAADQPAGSPPLSMTVWNGQGEVICCLRLTVETVACDGTPAD